MNKKGAGQFLAVLVALAVLIGAGSLAWIAFAPQSAVGSQPTAAAVKDISVASKDGTSASLRVYCKNTEGTNRGNPVATAIWVTDNKNGGRLSTNTTSSATARTTIASTIGSELTLYCFDGINYYGYPKSVVVDRESMDIDVDTSQIIPADGVRIKGWKDGAVLAPSNANGHSVLNITLAANQEDTLDYLKVDVNSSTRAFNLYGFAINFTAATNIDNWKINGMVKGTVPERLKNNYDYFYRLESPKMLHEYDVYQTGTVVYKAGATNPAEVGTLIAVDAGYFKSVQSATSETIQLGAETDADSEANVGAADVITDANVL